MTDQPYLTCLAESEGSPSPSSLSGSGQSGLVKSTRTPPQSSQCDSATSRTSATCDVLPTGRNSQSMFFAVETPARSTVEHAAMGTLTVPTLPDTSLPWPEDTARGGWSARMFLHQLLTTSPQPWSHLDTERLLSEQTPHHLRAKLGSGISLSDVIKPPSRSYAGAYRSAKTVRGLMRRSLARGRSLRVLLRTERDTIPAIVTFTTPADCESWTLKSENNSLDSLAVGLMAFLKAHAPSSTETRSCRQSRDRSQPQSTNS